MKAYRDIEKSPSRTEQIKAGATILVGMGLLGALQFFLKHRAGVAEVLWAIGATAFAASLIPPFGRWLYIGWMGLGVTIGMFTQPIVVTVAYVVLFVPVGFLFRAMGRDLMKRRMPKGAPSYWEDYDEPDDPISYFKQY